MARGKKAPVIATAAAAAKRVGVSERVLRSWLAAGCPGKRGHYDCAQIAAWREGNKRPAPPVGGDKWEERRRAAVAQREELKLQRERGELIAVSRAAQIVGQHIAEVATHLDALPDFAVAGQRLAAEAKKKITERLKAKIRELRATLEKSLRDVALTAKRDAGAENDQ